MSDKISTDDLAVVVSFSRPVGDGGQVHLQTTVKQSITSEDMNKLVDSLHAAGKRFASWSALELADNHLEQNEVAEVQNMLEVQNIRTRTEGVPRILTADKESLQKAQNNIVAAGSIRKKINSKIESLHKELGIKG